MSVNKNLPHLLVLPEDDKDRQLANGFHLELQAIRQVQVLNVACGWMKVLDLFKSDHVGGMEKYSGRFMVLLIDFDGKDDRLTKAKSYIPGHLIDRVFVLGVWTEPEELKTALGRTLERIGSELANDCRDNTNALWGHPLLQHNAVEIARLRDHVWPILFSGAASA